MFLPFVDIDVYVNLILKLQFTKLVASKRTYLLPLGDISLYVMTPEFGAQTQLEKTDMLDFADAVAIAINKFDRRGAQDAYRDVCKQVQGDREAFSDDANIILIQMVKSKG